MPSGWEDSGLQSITIPADAAPADPHIYIGDDDPLAIAAGQDASMSLYFNTASAFLIAVETFGTHNDGQLNIYGVSQDGPNTQVSFLEFGYGTGYLGGAQYGYITLGKAGVQDIDFDNNQYVNFSNGQNVEFQNGGDVEIGPAGQISLGTLPFPADVIVYDGTLQDDDGLSYLKGESNTTLVSFVALSQTTVAVVFAVAFPAGVTPEVMTNINSGSGVTARWGSRAIGVTNTGFNLFVFKMEAAAAAQTWANIPVQWTATMNG